MRILLVEDNQRLAAIIKEGIERNGYVVDQAGSIGSAQHLLRSFDYQLIVLDLGLPDGHGLDFLRRIRRTHYRQPCLIVTALDGLSDRVNGLDSGADDYVVKPFAMLELNARIKALLRRPVLKEYERLTHGNLVLELETRSIRVNGVAVEFAPREIAVIEVLLRSRDFRCSREKIEGYIYGVEQAVTPNALEVLMHRLRKRLAGSDAGFSIHAIRGFGYEVRDR